MVRSPAARTTATAVRPLPVTVLVTVPEVPVKTTETEAPDSAVRVTTPPAAVASADVAPPETPLPRPIEGAGGCVESVM